MLHSVESQGSSICLSWDLLYVLFRVDLWSFGLPSTIRTCDLQLRRLLLYPSELWAVDLYYIGQLPISKDLIKEATIYLP